MTKLNDYETDTIVDTLRELRHVLESNDLLDDDLSVSILGCLEMLGVADASEN